MQCAFLLIKFIHLTGHIHQKGVLTWGMYSPESALPEALLHIGCGTTVCWHALSQSGQLHVNICNYDQGVYNFQLDRTKAAYHQSCVPNVLAEHVMKQLALYISVGIRWRANHQFPINLIIVLAINRAVATNTRGGYFNANHKCSKWTTPDSTCCIPPQPLVCLSR